MSLESRLSFLSTTFSPEQAAEAEALHRLIEEKQAGRLVECLDDGFVRLVDHMGNDSAIVQAARVSYGKGTKSVSDDRTLIRFLMRMKHETPTEMCEVKLHVRVPMDCWRQWVRHRTASINEASTRYSVAIDAAQQASEWRLQSTTNRQGSAGGQLDWPEGYTIEPDGDGLRVFDDRGYTRMLYPFDNLSPAEYLTAREQEIQTQCRDAYEERLRFGVAREQARKDLPLSTYTEAYWKCDLRNLLHFLELRMDSHAQVEIRAYANVIAGFVKTLFPIAWEAFEDYRLYGMTLSRPEIEEIKRLLHPDWTVQFKALTGREQKELRDKLDRLGISYAMAT